MDFEVHVFIGWQWRAPNQSRRSDPAPLTEPFNSSAIDLASGYAGSYHVLELGLHFNAYTTPGSAPPYISAAWFPNWSPASQLLERNRAADITGNIGEVIAGCIAHRVCGVQSSAIAHLRGPQKRTPDYLLAGNPDLNAYMSGISGIPATRLPVYWPMESKARLKSTSRSVSEEALRQLVSYWIGIKDDYPEGVGYGMIVSTELEPARITMSLLLPRNGVRARVLRRYLNWPGSYEYFRTGGDLNLITRCLRGFDG
jgi:hypothetical protein